MILNEYEKILHDATITFCKKNGYWFYGSKNDVIQAILVKNGIGLYDFKELKYPEIVKLDALFNEIFPEQISDFSKFILSTLDHLNKKSVMLETMDDYKELILQSTILFCHDNLREIKRYSTSNNSFIVEKNNEDPEYIFYGQYFTKFDELLADVVFDDIRDRDLNYSEYQDDISAEYIENNFNKLETIRLYHSLNQSVSTKEVKMMRAKI